MDIMGMMKTAQAVQAKLQEAQEELGRLEVEGQAGGGMVSLHRRSHSTSPTAVSTRRARISR